MYTKPGSIHKHPNLLHKQLPTVKLPNKKRSIVADNVQKTTKPVLIVSSKHVNLNSK